MEIVPHLTSPVMPPSDHSNLSFEDNYSLTQTPSPLSHSPIASPPAALINNNIASPLTSSDCSCSDFWFGCEDSLQTKIIHERYMKSFDLSTTRKHASRAPIAFIGTIIRRQISKNTYYKIMRSADAIIPKPQDEQNKPNRKNPQSAPPSSADSDNRSLCCKSNELNTNCESCRLYTIDEIIINQRDCVPLGYTMKKIQSCLLITMWDNYDGLPVHQHRIRRWPTEIVDKNVIKPHSWIECNPLYDDDPTGIHCTDASFVYSTHLCKKNSFAAEKGNTTNNATSSGVNDNSSNDAVCLGYASMNQPCIFDALRRLGRPTDAESVRQLNATCNESGNGENDGNNNSSQQQNQLDHQENTDENKEKLQNDDEDEDALEEEEEEEDRVESDNDNEDDNNEGDYHSDTEEENNHEDDEDNVSDNDTLPTSSSLPSATKPTSIRRHHTEGSSSSSHSHSCHRNNEGGIRRAKSMRSKSDDEADEAAKLMAQLGLGSFGIKGFGDINNKNKNNHLDKFCSPTADTADDDIEEEEDYGSDIDESAFSSNTNDELTECDHGNGW